MRLTLLFYAFASLCLGLVAVASGGARALAIVGGQVDPESFDRVGVILAILIAGYFLFAAVLTGWDRPRDE